VIDKLPYELVRVLLKQFAAFTNAWALPGGKIRGEQSLLIVSCGVSLGGGARRPC